MMSVAVVKKMLELWAGFMPIYFMSRGIAVSDTPADKQFTSIPR